MADNITASLLARRPPDAIEEPAVEPAESEPGALITVVEEVEPDDPETPLFPFRCDDDDDDEYVSAAVAIDDEEEPVVDVVDAPRRWERE